MKKTFTKVASVLFVALLAIWTSNASAQDGCANAAPIACGDVVLGSTVGATPFDGPTCVTAASTGGAHWYSWTGTGDLVTITTCNAGSTYDTKLFVYTGACGALNCVTGNDDSACAFSGLRSTVNFTSVAGVDYLIAVSGFGAATGSYEMSMTCVAPVAGCTNPIACNFDPLANVDDGSCDFVTCAGCTDAGACNFDPLATLDDGSCDFSCIGCTDPLACNFDVAHTIDDGSCCFDLCYSLVVTGGTFPGEVGWSVTDALGTLLASGGPGSFSLCLTDGCYTFGMTDSFGDGWNGAIYTITDGGGNVVLTGNLDTATNGDGVSFGSEVLQAGTGCVVGCTDPLACNFDPLADFDSGCDFVSCAGCTDPLAANFDPSATIDDGSCVFCGAGEVLAFFDMTDSFGDGWNGATYTLLNDINVIVASGDLDNAQIGDGFSVGTDQFCLAPGCYTLTVTGGTFPGEVGWSFSDQLGNAYGANGPGDYNIDFGFTGTCAFPGCTDPIAINFDPNASVDDGTCIFPPANNDVCNAEAVTCGLSVAGTTINASDNEGLIGTFCGTPNVSSPGVWYVFNAAADEQVIASTCNSLGGDTKIHVYAAAPDCNNLVCIGGNDDGCGVGFLSEIAFSAQTGNDYYILVSEFGTGVGIDFTLDITCQSCPGIPTNDDCANAIPLPTNGASITASICCANVSDAPNFAAGFGSAYDVFYSVNSSDFDTFFFDITNDSGSEIGLMIYDGDCNTLDDIAGCIVTGQCAGDIADFLPLTANTDYYFAVFTTDPAGCGDYTITATGIYLGCTDDTACNYDPGANQDDGSCEYISCGAVPANNDCANAEVLTCNTTVSGSTGGSTAAGAPTLLACDPAPGAGVWYNFVGTGDLVTLSTCGSVIDSKIIVWEAADCAGPFTCTTDVDGNFASETTDFGSCGFFDQDDASVTFISGVGTNYYIYIAHQDVDGNPVTPDWGSFVLDISCEPVVFGCTNPAAYNYDPAANIEDGSCDFFSQTCAGGPGTPVILNMFDSFGDGWNDATYTISLGDGTPVASGDLDGALYTVDEDNFTGPESGFDLLCLQDGCYTIVVTPGVFGGEVSFDITDELGNVLVSGAPGTYNFTIGSAICGCTDPGACNFDPAATDDDGTCEYLTCAGCTDPAACNFDGSATIDDGSCCFDTCVNIVVTGGTFPGEVSWSMSDTDGNVLAGGGPGTVSLCLPNPDYCFIFEMFDSFGDGWNGATYTVTTNGGVFVASGDLNTAAEGDGSSFGVDQFGIGAGCVTGCAEPVACNYDPAVNIPDCEACDYSSCLGCTYDIATNFDPTAGIDDGSCTFDLANPCPEDLNGDGIINAADLLQFLGAFGSTC